MRSSDVLPAPFAPSTTHRSVVSIAQSIPSRMQAPSTTNVMSRQRSAAIAPRAYGAVGEPPGLGGTVGAMSAAGTKRIGIIVVAYNAASTLAQVLDRIPADFVPQISDVLVCDDASQDATFLVGLGYQQVSELPLTIIRREKNLGYGGNQKAAYEWAIEHGLDIVVLLHGDGQYAPEHLPKMVEPLLAGECDAVFGSRMMDKGAARRGGMPLYKFVGNRILTTVQNAVVGTSLSEWHSGYRVYSVAALRDIPFEQNHDGFDFDTQIIIQLVEAGKRIVEIPIPTYYGDEICYVDGIGYARDVVTDSLRYRAHKIGLGSGDDAFASRDYELKDSDISSHTQIVQWLTTSRQLRILDLGCAAGHLAAELRKHGHTVVGVDVEEAEGVRERVDEFVRRDLDDGLGDAVRGPFDVVLAADVLEHVREPGQLLADARRVLAPEGVVVACVPNFGHWYPRMRVASGTFAYERRGILDAGHVRFFTRRSFNRLVRKADFDVVRRRALGVPFEVLGRGGRAEPRRLTRVVGAVDRAAVAVWPTLFAYQFLVELRPTAAAAAAPRVDQRPRRLLLVHAAEAEADPTADDEQRRDADRRGTRCAPRPSFEPDEELLCADDRGEQQRREEVGEVAVRDEADRADEHGADHAPDDGRPEARQVDRRRAYAGDARGRRLRRSRER